MTSSLSLHLHNEERLWFPGQTAELVADFISRDQVDRTLVEQYGTARWLTGNPDRTAADAGYVRIGSHAAKIENLFGVIAAKFEGLCFADGHDPQIREQIQAAVEVLTHIPAMAESVGTVAKAIHPLRAPRDHDVSHSTPELPFSVFISIPEKGERDSSLRVAESLIHEAMHLQLTLVDSADPLIVDNRANGYSPWKEEVRPVTGLLHGLYVFAVIHQVLGLLTGIRDDWNSYCSKRRSAIEGEIRCLPERPNGLSEFGMELWRRCSDSVIA